MTSSKYTTNCKLYIDERHLKCNKWFVVLNSLKNFTYVNVQVDANKLKMLNKEFPKWIANQQEIKSPWVYDKEQRLHDNNT